VVVFDDEQLHGSVPKKTPARLAPGIESDESLAKDCADSVSVHCQRDFRSVASMVVDLHELSVTEPFSIEADVCIVGAGAAGLTLARSLLRQGRTVLLAESGGVDYEAATAELGEGTVAGERYYDLADSHLRLFGGTTAIWGGRCAELDEIDFERRDWIPFSGWPIDKAALAPYYALAWDSLGLRRADPERFASPRMRGVQAWFGRDFRLAWWQFDRRRDRYGYSAQRDLADDPRLRLVLHATVTDVHLTDDLRRVDHAVVQSLQGHRGTLRARQFVLAAGGLENPRILLSSRTQCAAGIGNTYDLVGRFFMEHPHARAGRLQPQTERWALLRAFGAQRYEGASCAAMLCASESLQRDQSILNSSLVPRLRPHPRAAQGLGRAMYEAVRQRMEPKRSGRALWHAYKRVRTAMKRVTHPLLPWTRLSLDTQGLYLSVRAEQAPNPNSRVRLGEARDGLGMPRIVLDWRLSELDRRTLGVMTERLDRALQDSGTGRVQPAEWLARNESHWEFDPLISRHPIGGYHHMGTTRMADSPRAGVVDRDCRVHDMENLWVAGSSVFPTSGWANPTLSIIALSLRLADRLEFALAA
jgi:choline dehydrogenase-like flavoprotein